MSILGADDRVRITPTATGAYRAVVEIEVVFPDGTSVRGSGALVGRNDVLTAGHMVYNPLHGGYARDVFVYPSRDGALQPFGAANGTKITVDPKWISGSVQIPAADFTHDIALVNLDRNLGDLVGWFGYASGGTVDQYTNSQVITAGYPGDKPYATQWRASSTVDSSTATTLDFTRSLDIFNGQSGSPVFVGDETRGLTIVGVVSNENAQLQRNQVVRISSEFAPALSAAIAGDAPEGVWPVSSADAGNSRAAAKPMALPLGSIGTVGFASDPADWFSFVASGTGRVELSLTGLGNDLDLVLTDAAGVVLAASRQDGTASERVVADVAAGATYYVQVAPKISAGALSGYLLNGLLATPNAIVASAADALVVGTAAADVIIADGGGQRIFAGSGDDRIEVRAFGAAGVTVNGGDGRDTVAISGPIAGYSRQISNGTIQLTPFDGVGGVASGANIKLAGIEYLQFSDRELFVLSLPEAIVARLYTTAFGRLPDHPGLGVQLDAFAAGAGFGTLARNFVGSSEFQARFGGANDATFLDGLYANALGRAADAGGKSFWLSYLASGHDRAEVVMGFATSVEQAARTGDWLLIA
jgi:V8-like Glu-specific endopeptidase